MKLTTVCLCFCVFAGLQLPTLSAHDGDESHDHDDTAEREWTFAENGTRFPGQFVSAKDGRVRIRRPDGWVRTIEISLLSDSDQQWIAARMQIIEKINTVAIFTSQESDQRAARLPNRSRNTTDASKDEHLSLLQKSFEPFRTTVKTRSDSDFFYVESNGIPNHEMMVGITAWQQQVPLPQKYTGSNAWQIPRTPVPAENPLSAKTNFFRGAIAIAVNGIPIFNPIKNDGRTDTFTAGELDNWGGHCGRGDDYHYHIAPVHLQKQTGPDTPIAWALDGYPIYGYQDEQAPDFAPLDQWNGHKDERGNYHYHATPKYPYVNGGFYGEVTEREGQVDPQPRAESPRPALPPLQGATIVDFESPKPGQSVLTYEIRGRKGTVSYTVANDGSVKFAFKTPDGKTSTEEYEARPSRGNRQGPQGRPPRDNNEPRNGGRRPPREGMPDGSVKESSRAQVGNMKLTSSSVNKEGSLHVDCTCDGKGESPAIAWTNVPKEAKSIAISLWHTAPDQEKSYWVVYNIPTSATGLKQNQKDLGKLGHNDRKKAAFDPMCSQGPGVKTYHITVFALSEELKLSPQQATHKGLLDAVRNCTVAETTLDFNYERP